MSADSIVYYLERLSDYRDFERLRLAFLSGASYPGVDPLGGTGARAGMPSLEVTRRGKEVNGLDETQLRKSVGAETAALLRPKKGDGVTFQKNEGDQ